ncbi:lantibiotic protection ABC transporter ATP-binding protein [Alloscardovia venturai]|uniref:Lantibiotic protection ABC transporter ATP-binding protein n=1 Tax=Alloscardovia venturai TaxID=1769421 RepID=A0ABW2Y906_9BIFI
MDYALRTHNLVKKFRKQIAVSSLNLEVPEGSIYGLLGPNGAGKSTTLKMIAGMIHPTSGSIEVQGHNWTRDDLYTIGSLIEQPALYAHLTARENLEVRALLLGIDKQRIDEVLKTVDLTTTGSKKVGQFSLGMKQRLGIALALLTHPHLLILDEPTNGLDPVGIEDLRRLIQSFPAQGITVIISSHILSEISKVANYVGIIAEGCLVHQSTLTEDMDLEQIFMSSVREAHTASLQNR